MMRRTGAGIVLSVPALALITGFLVVPVVLMLLLAFGVDLFSARPPAPMEILHRLATSSTWGAVFTSLSLSIPVVIVCTVLGLGFAVLMTKVGRGLQAVLTGALFLPLLTGEIVFGYGWLIILGRNGIVNSMLLGLGLIDEPLSLLYRPATIVIGLIGVLLPFAALPLSTAYAAINPELRLAAASLGASRTKTSLQVTLPLLLPAIISGASIVYAISMSAYAVPALLGGRKVHTLPLEIYAQYITAFNWPAGSALALVLVVLVLVPVRLLARAQSGMHQEG